MKTQVSFSPFQFKRPKPDGAIQMFNEKSYLMGEYHQGTGKVSWYRVVLAAQRERVESWLLEHYPVNR
jgi:hypothetical protein